MADKDKSKHMGSPIIICTTVTKVHAPPVLLPLKWLHKIKFKYLNTGFFQDSQANFLFYTRKCSWLWHKMDIFTKWLSVLGLKETLKAHACKQCIFQLQACLTTCTNMQESNPKHLNPSLARPHVKVQKITRSYVHMKHGNNSNTFTLAAVGWTCTPPNINEAFEMITWI